MLSVSGKQQTSNASARLNESLDVLLVEVGQAAAAVVFTCIWTVGFTAQLLHLQTTPCGIGTTASQCATVLQQQLLTYRPTDYTFMEEKRSVMPLVVLSPTVRLRSKQQLKGRAKSALRVVTSNWQSRNCSPGVKSRPVATTGTDGSGSALQHKTIVTTRQRWYRRNPRNVNTASS
jgi:hypothetical protein